MLMQVAQLYLFCRYVFAKITYLSLDLASSKQLNSKKVLLSHHVDLTSP
jgi:hypothetical protein